MVLFDVQSQDFAASTRSVSHDVQELAAETCQETIPSSVERRAAVIDAQRDAATRVYTERELARATRAA